VCAGGQNFSASGTCFAPGTPQRSEEGRLVVKKPGSALAGDELLAFFDGKIAKWWKPEAVVFVDSVPLGATGKVLKHQLREQFGDFYLSA
jgi:fatty-acyl-CoA synthase